MRAGDLLTTLSSHLSLPATVCSCSVTVLSQCHFLHRNKGELQIRISCGILSYVAAQEEMIFKLRSCLQLTKLCSGRAATFNISVRTFSDIVKPQPTPVNSTVNTFLAMDACATDLISFIDSTPTPFHLVETSEALLLQSGFSKLDEREMWAANKMIVPGGKYFYHRNRSTIVAFTVGARYVPGGEFKVVYPSLSERGLT